MTLLTTGKKGERRYKEIKIGDIKTYGKCIGKYFLKHNSTNNKGILLREFKIILVRRKSGPNMGNYMPNYNPEVKRRRKREEQELREEAHVGLEIDFKRRSMSRW